MKILVIGGGGREHALVWKLKQSPECTDLFCAPGNAGIDRMAQAVPIGVGQIDKLAAFAKKERIDLVVVGPEMPLADGIADVLRDQGTAVFGPSKEAAQIEGSKIFARRLMENYGIPTPEFESFTDPTEALDFVHQLASRGKQCVVKADGLAAGKGAIVTSTMEEADRAIRQCLVDKQFGEAGSTVVIEERLHGPELSILAVTDGKKIAVLPPSQDHKPIGEGDTGLNTGGMGAYSPVPVVSDDLIETIRKTVLVPAIQGMESEGVPYTGVLYAGLMLCENHPYVIEFNCRFGDPETQAVLPAIGEDLLPLLLASAQGDMKEDRIIPASQSALCVVMASGGYPGSYEKGKEIHGLYEAASTMGDRGIVFHAGTKDSDGKTVTSGGRVLGVTGLGTDFDEACSNAYQAVELIEFENACFRKDIGYRVRSK